VYLNGELKVAVAGRDDEAGISPQEQQARDAKYAHARREVETRLLAGEQELRSTALRAESELRALHEHIQSCLYQFAQADADLRSIPPSL
jgi:hypothetical protein